MLLTIGLWGSWSNSAPHISHPSWTSMYISLMTVAEAHANKQKHVIPLKLGTGMLSLLHTSTLAKTSCDQAQQ